MTNVDLRAFMDHKGWSEVETARRLGCSRGGLRNWLAGTSNAKPACDMGLAPVPLYIALACDALHYNLPPWRAKP